MYVFKKLCLVVTAVSFVVSVCEREDTLHIELDIPPSEVVFMKDSIGQETIISLALGSMTMPEQGCDYYKELVGYLEKYLGQEVNMLDKNSYAQVMNDLKDANLDVAFVCGRSYIEGAEKFGLELLVAPQVMGSIKYYSYIIVHRDSAINKFKDLRGKNFAFTDPLSNTGRLVPTYMVVKKFNNGPEDVFNKCLYSGSHDKSIDMVAAKIVDAAAVDSLVWEYLSHVRPKKVANTKIIKVSEPFGIPPVVVAPHLEMRLKSKIKQLFLAMHKNPEGQDVLRKMRIDRFVAVDDSNYNDVRDVKMWLKERNIFS